MKNNTINWNQSAIDRIRQCFPTAPTQGPVGRKPIDYLKQLRQEIIYKPQRCDGTLTQPLENIHPCALGRCSRAQIRAICHDPAVDVLEAYAAVMAWGGQRTSWFLTSIQHHAELRKLLCQLRASMSPRYDDFGLTKKVATDVKGLGISFYTKLLYFFRPVPDAYILDQRTAKSIRVLTGNIIKLTRQGTPDPSTNPQQYEDFCLAIEQLGQLLGGWTGEEVEQALFDRRGGCWRSYVEKNIGVADPNAPEAPEYELDFDEESDPCESIDLNKNQDSEKSCIDLNTNSNACNACPIWLELSSNPKCRNAQGTSIPTMGGRAEDLLFCYDPIRDQVRVWRDTGKLDFFFGKEICKVICMRYQQGLRNRVISRAPSKGGTSYFNKPKWDSPPLGRIDTPYAAAIIHYIWLLASGNCLN